MDAVGGVSGQEIGEALRIAEEDEVPRLPRIRIRLDAAHGEADIFPRAAHAALDLRALWNRARREDAALIEGEGRAEIPGHEEHRFAGASLQGSTSMTLAPSLVR